MRVSAALGVTAIVVAATLSPIGAIAQSAINLAALEGLLPVSTLLNTARGRAALAKNLAMTAEIQHGTALQATLLPFPAQQEQALRDAFITGGNALELADGLGTTLATAYGTFASCSSRDDGKTSTCSTTLPAFNALLGYTWGLTASDADASKYFFADETVPYPGGPAPASQQAVELLAAADGAADIYGRAYHLPAGAPTADPFGNPRPFQTEPQPIAAYSGTDYFGMKATNKDYLYGPLQQLVQSPSFPSAHATYAYTESLLLAILVPQRYTQMITRAAEFGNDRVILGAHYVMDVLGGRTLASYDLAHLLAGNPAYTGLKFGAFTIVDYAGALMTARAQLTAALESSCGGTITVCASKDTGRFSNEGRNAVFYASTQTYNLPVVHPASAQHSEDVAQLAPEAGYLLTAAFPRLTLAQADRILTQTEGAGGGFLDDGSAFGLYSRLDLFQAGQRAAAAIALPAAAAR